MWLHAACQTLGLIDLQALRALQARRERNLAETARHQGGFAVVPKLTEQSNEDRGRTGRTGEETGQGPWTWTVMDPVEKNGPRPAGRQGQLAGAAAAAGQDRPWEAGKVLTGRLEPDWALTWIWLQGKESNWWPLVGRTWGSLLAVSTSHRLPHPCYLGALVLYSTMARAVWHGSHVSAPGRKEALSWPHPALQR